MTEENNAFGEFGARSSKFEELLKKYQTIDENGNIISASEAEAPKKSKSEKSEKKDSPEREKQPDREPEAEEPIVEDSVQDESVAVELPEEDVKVEEQVTIEQPSEETVADEFVIEEMLEDEPIFDELITEELPEEEPKLDESLIVELPQEEPLQVAENEVNTVPVQEPAEEYGFSFDEKNVNQAENADEKQSEPDFSYDLEMFSSDKTRTVLDFDRFDDSWLDSALDESVFYNAQSVIPAQPAEPEIAQPNPEPEKKAKKSRKASKNQQAAEKEPEIQTVTEVAHFVEQIPDEADKNAMAGGYIAPSDLSDFAFDPDSGMDFGLDDEPMLDTYTDVAEQNNKPTKEKKRKAEKVKKDSGKNEMTSVTGFSKDYKASEGKGSKKDGFFVSNFVPKKSDSTGDKTRKIIMIICVVAFLSAAMFLFNDYVITPLKNSSQTNKLETLIGDGDKIADKASLADKYPDIVFPEGMLEKYADLYAENQDLVGWLKIDGLDISQPVVKGEDNNKYLKKDFGGNSSKYGTAFMNCSNKADILNYNTSIFAHNMKDSKMFGNLVEYKSVEGYKKAPIIEFNTIYGDYKWKVFAAFITNGTEDGDDGYLFNYMFTDLSDQSAAGTEKFLGEVNQRSLYQTDVDVKYSDKILTLSTCTYEFDEARLVVMARMVRPGESEAVSGSVKANPNPRYPAAYYSENNLTNPFASAYKWHP